MALYKGFSTYNRLKKFRVTDFELAKVDLLNHFNIRKGSKLMNPNFGTIIWDTLFEPLTDDIKTAIIADIKSIVSYDPRLNIDNVIITEFDQGLQIELSLIYVPQNNRNTLYLQFARDARTVNTL